MESALLGAARETPVLGFCAGCGNPNGPACKDDVRGTTGNHSARRAPENPASTNQLMEKVCERENLKRALQRVKANKGSPGIDGMSVEELPGYLQQHWPAIREQLLKRDLRTETGEAGGNRQAGRR